MPASMSRIADILALDEQVAHERLEERALRAHAAAAAALDGAHAQQRHAVDIDAARLDDVETSGLSLNMPPAPGRAPVRSSMRSSISERGVHAAAVWLVRAEGDGKVRVGIRVDGDDATSFGRPQTRESPTTSVVLPTPPLPETAIFTTAPPPTAARMSIPAASRISGTRCSAPIGHDVDAVAHVRGRRG